MTKVYNKRIFESKDIDWNSFNIYTINNDKSITFRCKYCRMCRIKKVKSKIIKISGHKKNCIALLGSKDNKNKILKNSIDINDKNINSSYKNIKINIENQEEIVNNESNFDTNESKYITKINLIENNKLNIPKEENQKLFKLLINVFDKKNNLNKYQEELGIYYVNKTKVIGKGSVSTVFLGEDKFQRINVAVLQINIDNYEKFYNESFVLQRIHGKGNFQDDDYFYMVENLMGPNLHILYKMCDYKFDYYTVINIAIDLVKNIKIMHNIGFIHKDLKPDNLVYGNLCFENCERRNEIGIIDFSHSKINIKSNGELNYSDKKVKFRGNNFFSSTNALQYNDVNEKDDIISLFYILIYFMKGWLPWKIKNSNGENISKKEIIEIRKKWPIKKLCEDIPKDFQNLAQKIIETPKDEYLDHNIIIENLEKIKKKEECKQNSKTEKFCWIKLLKQFEENPSDIEKMKREKIKEMLNKYCLNLKDYLIYIST